MKSAFFMHISCKLIIPLYIFGLGFCKESNI